MGTISSAIGLITGFPIQETVEQAGQPRRRADGSAADRKTPLCKPQQTAYTTLSADLLSLEYTTNGFDSSSLTTLKT